MRLRVREPLGRIVFSTAIVVGVMALAGQRALAD
jgi:hypothetical protein